MRCKIGSMVSVFNNVCGEWLAKVGGYGKSGCELLIDEEIRPAEGMRSLFFAYAPVKQSCGQVVAQATELGVTNIVPVITERTIVRKINEEKLRQNAIEAAEQSERLQVPVIHPAMSLANFLKSEPWQGKLLFFKERGSEICSSLPLTGDGHCVLIGPEGGFTDSEVQLIESHHSSMPINLGRRVMKATTAAVAGLSVYQSLYGRWH